MLIKAAKVMNVSPTDLWTKVRGRHLEIEFINGNILMSATELIISNYILNISRLFGVIPLKEHTINNYYKNDVLCPASFVDAYNGILWHCVDELNIADDPVKIYTIVKAILVSNNTLYNDLVCNTSEHIVAIDLLDFINLAEDPVLLGMRAESTAAGDTPDSTAIALDKGGEYLMGNNALDRSSSIAWHCRRSLVKLGQALQACMLRGYLHDIDKSRIEKPIIANLTEGLSLTDYALLSRESSITMATGNGDIQKVSVEGRKMSYVAGNKSRIIAGDCGTTELIPWKVTKSDGTALYQTWFHTDDNKNLRIYTPADAKKYENQTIHRRSPLTCKLPNRKHTCSKCFGVLSQSIPHNRNVGVTIAKYIAAIFVQGTLSTKHYVASMGSGVNVLDAGTAVYFKMKNDAIYLKKKPGIKKLELIFKQEALHDIQAVLNVKDVHSITMSRITSIGEGVIHITKTQKEDSGTFYVNEGKNKSMLSYSMADHIRRNPELLTTRGGEYHIDITDFDKSEPVFIRAAKMVNLSDSSGKIIAALERAASVKSNEAFSKAYGIMDTLEWLIVLMSSTWGISASAVELLFSAYITDTDTHLLPRGLTDTKHRKLHELIRNRSLSAWFLFDRSTEAFTQPGPLLAGRRMNGPLDVIVAPEAVLKAVNERKKKRLKCLQQQ